MSQQIIKKFIGDKEVGSAKILLEKNFGLKAVNQSDAEVDLIKINSEGAAEILGAEVASKSYADSAASAAQSAAESYADSAIGDLDSDDIDEGGVNLYFTEARAKSAAVADSISDGVSDVAPSQNAVFDALALKLDSSMKGANSGLAELDANGKVPSAQLPAIAITDTFVVASEAAQLALTAQVGDVAIRTDLSKSFILAVAGADTLGNWQELLSPADSVSSVNGQTGAVSLDSDDISEGSSNLYYTSARFDSDFGGKDTDDLGEGSSNLYYTEARFDSSLSGKDSDDVSEGSSNLYFTDARAKSAAVVNSTSGTETDQAASVSAMKSFVSSAVGAATDWVKEKITLGAGDISAQYVDLAHVADVDSIVGFVARLGIHSGDDYTTSTVSSKTRISFAGPLATAGNSALVAGDVLYFTYAKA